MKVRVLTLRLDPATGAFDDSALVALMSEVEAMDVSDHLFVHEGSPTLVLVVRYRAPRPPPGGHPAAPRRASGAAPPAADLATTDRPLFDTLRRWRNDRAKRDGRPAYVLLTNNQLVAIATAKPTTKAALQAIPARSKRDERHRPGGAPRSGGVERGLRSERSRPKRGPRSVRGAALR